MDITNLIATVSRYSNLVGNSLASPLSGIVITFLADIFQANRADHTEIIEKINSDENAAQKILDLEKWLFNLQNQNIRVILVLFPTLGLIFVIGILFLLYCLDVPNSEALKDVLIGGTSFLAFLIFIIYNHYFSDSIDKIKSTLTKRK